MNVISLLPGFVAWYQLAKDVVAEQFAQLSESDKLAADIESVDDFALEIYSSVKGLTPAEFVVS